MSKLFYNVNEAAEFLNMVPQSVRRAVKDEKLPATKVDAPINQHGYYLKIAHADLVAFRDRPRQNRGGRPRIHKVSPELPKRKPKRLPVA